MITLGLTGSIGMGKSTTAQMFRDRNIPVWDADETVHRLYAPDGLGARAIADLYPESVGPEGVDRALLRSVINRDPDALEKIEKAIHPLVAADRRAFRDAHPQSPVVVFDIPLLFETGAEAWLDRVAVVSTSAETQKARVLDRPGMDEAMFEQILSKQVPDTEKRRRADFVIRTDSLEQASSDVDALLQRLKER